MMYRFCPPQLYIPSVVLLSILFLAGCGSGTPSPTPPPPAPPLGPSLSSIQITPQTSAIVLGHNQQFTAMGTFSDGSTRDLTKSVTWTSSTTSAFIGNGNGLNGFATGIAGGQTTVIASQGSVQATANLTVSVPLPRLAYAPSQNVLFGFSVDPTSGLLTALPDSPFRQGFGGGFFLDPAGAFGFAFRLNPVHYYWSSTYRVIISPTGNLADAESWLTPSYGGPLQIDPARRFVFQAWGGGFFSFPMDSRTGEVNIKGETKSSYPCGVSEWRVEQTGKFVFFVCASSAEVLASRIDPKTGALTGLPTRTPLQDSQVPVILIDPTGQFMYFLKSDSISAYSINADTGALSLIETHQTTGAARGAISPDAKTLYVTHWSGTTPSISGVSIEPVTGKLQEVPWSPISVSADPFALAVDPSGKFLYAQSQEPSLGPFVNPSTIVSVYTIDPASGALAKVADQTFSDSNGFGPYSLSLAY